MCANIGYYIEKGKTQDKPWHKDEVDCKMIWSWFNFNSIVELCSIANN